MVGTVGIMHKEYWVHSAILLIYILGTVCYNIDTQGKGKKKTEKDTGKGGRKYRKGKQEHQEERNGIREIEKPRKARCLKPTAAGSPSLEARRFGGIQTKSPR